MDGLVFDIKIAVVVRDDLVMWQKLNVIAFFISGIVGAYEGLLGASYEDAVGNIYHWLLVQSTIVLSADAGTIAAIYQRTFERGVRVAFYINDMFAIGYDVANRAAVRKYLLVDMEVVGLALCEDKKIVDKIIKGATFHQ